MSHSVPLHILDLDDVIFEVILKLLPLHDLRSFSLTSNSKACMEKVKTYVDHLFGQIQLENLQKFLQQNDHLLLPQEIAIKNRLFSNKGINVGPAAKLEGLLEKLVKIRAAI